MKGRKGNRASPGLERTSERADHSTSTSGSWNGKRYLGVVQALQEPFGNLEGAAATACLTESPSDDGPAAYEKEDAFSSVDFLEAAFTSDEELVVPIQVVLQLPGLCPSMSQSRLVREIQASVLDLRRLRYH